MGCFSCLFPRRKEIVSSRIEDSNATGSGDAQFVIPDSPAAGTADGFFLLISNCSGKF